MTEGSLTVAVCRFAAGLSLEATPEAVRRKAKLHILDTLGCGLAGAGSTLARQVLRWLALEHAPGPVPVPGTEARFGPAAAAFANATAMNALDFDDGLEVAGKGLGHPGATLVAAALSAAFAAPRPPAGGAFLAAMVAAYELNNRLIQAIQPSFERFREVYGVCQHQSLGAAVAYGKLMGLEAAALENALGFAATLTSLPSLRKYNFEARPLISFKDFNAPAAEAGVRAVQLDACGLTAARAVLEGPGGFWRMIGSDRFEPALLSEGLGERWATLDGSLKPWPACRWLHTALEAFERLLADHALAPAAIEAVVVHTSQGLARDFMDAAPATMVDAQFSFPWAFAALAHDVRPAAAWYEAASLRRADLLAFAGLVRAEVDAQVEALMNGPLRRPAGRVSVIAGGRRFESRLIEFPLGSRERPLTEAQVRAKFQENAAPVIGAARADELAQRVLEIEREADVAAVLRLAVG